jgi:hypothetical protein
VHCREKWEAELVRAKVTARMKECGLELHPEKTKIATEELSLAIDGCPRPERIPQEVELLVRMAPRSVRILAVDGK